MHAHIHGALGFYYSLFLCTKPLDEDGGFNPTNIISKHPKWDVQYLPLNVKVAFQVSQRVICNPFERKMGQ